MKVRGERECKDCGTRWSYYETGSISCPDCGSLHSVGVDDRTEHTAAAVDLDLTPVRAMLDDDTPVRETAGEAAAVCREYVRRHGFVDAGDLQVLSDTFLAAVELRYVADELERRMRVDDAEELYFLSLLRGADDGERPPLEEVPSSLRAPRGLAVATALAAYHRDVNRVLDEPEKPVRELLSRLREHRKRVEALDGDVSPREGERLLDAMQELSRYLVDGDEAALATARERLADAT